MRQLGFKLLFLALAVVFSLICVFRRNRARGAWLLLALDAALIACGAMLGLYSFRLSDWTQVLKLVPLALIAAGCAANIGHRAVLRRRRLMRSSAAQPTSSGEKEPSKPTAA